MQRMQAAGVGTALDTCGLCPPSALEQILPHTDLVLFDLKEIDGPRHRTLTGAGNRRILDNLLLVRDFIAARSPAPVLWIRTPLIPGATATPENIAGIGRFLAENMDGAVTRWELSAFNNLCRDKYRRLGMNWNYAATPLLSAAELEVLIDCARRSGVEAGSSWRREQPEAKMDEVVRES